MPRTSVSSLQYNRPVPSTRKNKKFMVKVRDTENNKDVIVHFGQVGYSDYTKHHDPQRKKNYLTRSAGIRDKQGRLTKDNPLSPNYWARRYLWGPSRRPSKIAVKRSPSRR